MSKYRVRIAFGTYSVGNVIEPTGLWRSELLSRGLIEPMSEQPPRKPLEPVGEPVATTETNEPRRRGRPAKTAS